MTVDLESPNREQGLVRVSDPLRIPELLLRVLELSDRQELAIATRICHQWFDTAVALLWESLSDFGPILRLLAILREVEASSMSVKEKNDRYWRYASLVKSLKFNMINTTGYTGISADVYWALREHTLDQLFNGWSLPSSGLLPNLQSLDVVTHTAPSDAFRLVSYFLHPSLKRLTILSTHIFAEFGAILRALTIMEGLKLEGLDLGQGHDAQVVEDEAMPCILRHRGTLSHLKLWTSDLVGPLQDHLPDLIQLHSIHFTLYDPSLADEFLKSLLYSRPGMSAIGVIILSDVSLDLKQKIWTTLLKFEALRSLRLSMPEVDELSERDIREMALSWPRLSQLYVTRNVSWMPSTRGFSLNTLATIANHYSESLTELGIYLASEDIPQMDSTSTSQAQFLQLRILDFGSSPSPKARDSLTQYLARILPRGVRFKSYLNTSWNDLGAAIDRQIREGEAQTQTSLVV